MVQLGGFGMVIQDAEGGFLAAQVGRELGI